MTATRRLATALSAFVLVCLLVLTATPAEAASRYHWNGCAKGSTVGRTQLVYSGSMPLPDGQRICFYAKSIKIPLLGWLRVGTVKRWAR